MLGSSRDWQLARHHTPCTISLAPKVVLVLGGNKLWSECLCIYLSVCSSRFHLPSCHLTLHPDIISSFSLCSMCLHPHMPSHSSINHPPIHSSTHPSIHYDNPFIYIPSSPSMHLCIDVFPSTYPHIYLSIEICLFIHLSMNPSVYASVHLSFCPYKCPHLYPFLSLHWCMGVLSSHYEENADVRVHSKAVYPVGYMALDWSEGIPSCENQGFADGEQCQSHYPPSLLSCILSKP